MKRPLVTVNNWERDMGKHGEETRWKSGHEKEVHEKER